MLLVNSRDTCFMCSIQQCFVILTTYFFIFYIKIIFSLYFPYEYICSLLYNVVSCSFGVSFTPLKIYCKNFQVERI